MSTLTLKPLVRAVVIAALAAATPAWAQHEGHTMPTPAPAKKPAPKPAPKPAAKRPAPKAAVDHSAMGHGPAPKAKATTTSRPAAVDHAAMGHGPSPKPAKARPKASTRPAAVDHAAMGHGPAPKAKAGTASKRAVVDHAAMGHGPAPTPKTTLKSAGAPAAVDHSAMGHSHPTTSTTKAARPKPSSAKPPAARVHTTPKAAPLPTAVDHAAMGHGASGAAPAAVDHAAMGHGTAPAAGAASALDHAAMGHAPPEPMDHATAGHGTPAASGTVDHAAMGHGPDADLPANAAPLTPIPAVTDADRAAAFPPVSGHAAHDRAIHSYWLADRLEWQDTDEGSLGWEGLAWVGGDINRLWLRTEGEASGGEVEDGNVEVLYGRSVSAWWDVVAGVRHDFGEGPSRTSAAIGVQGLSPYKFEVEATAYVGTSGRTAAVLEAEYDTLLTNRLILQWSAEAQLAGRADPARHTGSGLTTVEAGTRLRYEFTRRFAPYVGIEWERAFGGTADFRREHAEPVDDTRVVAGIRFWF